MQWSIAPNIRPWNGGFDIEWLPGAPEWGACGFMSFSYSFRPVFTLRYFIEQGYPCEDLDVDQLPPYLFSRVDILLKI